MRMSKARTPPCAHESMASCTKCVMRKPAVRGGGKRGRTRNHGDRRHVLCEEHVKAGQLTLCTAKLRDVPCTPTASWPNEVSSPSSPQARPRSNRTK